MYKIIFIIMLTLYFLFKIFLNILQYKNRNSKIPEELSGIYDEERYQKFKDYYAEKVKLNIVKDSINYLITLAIFLSNIFAFLFGDIENPYNSAIYILLTYIGISFIFDVIFSYVDNMIIEEKYGFNKTKLKTFIFDEIKSLILEMLLLIGTTLLFIVLYENLGDYILLLFTAIIFVVSMFISFIYPYLTKMQNKFKPLEVGDLKTKLTNLLESHNYHVRGIFVMDASRRTTKSNAYFAGFGKSKTIVLYDNLLKIVTPDEIVAIFAHEMGHGIHKDTLKQRILSLINIIAMVVLAWLLVKIPPIYNDFGFDSLNFGMGVIILINAVIPFVMTILNILSSFVSRKCEYRADEQAALEGYGEELISGLKKLNCDSLNDLNPHPLIVLLYYSHPTLLQRIRHIRDFNKKKEEANE